MSTALETIQPKSVVTRLHLPDLSDDMLGDYRDAVEEQRDELKLITHLIDLELERRMRENGAREIAHAKYKKIALEEQFSSYTADYEALNEAQRILRALGQDEDAAKIVTHVPERTTTIAAHDEYGSPVSIAALIRKYGPGSQLGGLLSRGLTRVSLGLKFTIRRKDQRV